MEVPALGSTYSTCNTTQHSTNVADRNLARAQRDQQTMLRRDERQFGDLSERFANDVGTLDTLKKHRETYQAAMDRAYQDLVSRNGQGYAEYAQTLIRARDDYRHAIDGTIQGVQTNTGTTGGTGSTGSTGGTTVDTRNLDRARNDLAAISRGVDREFGELRQRFGNNEDMDKLQKDFSSRVDAEFQSFVNGGASDYMGFAQRLASMRMSFRDEVRGFAQTLAGANTNTGTTNANATTTVDPNATSTAGSTNASSGADQHASIDVNDRNMARAQRDRDALARGIDREIEALTHRVGGNADAVDGLKKMRDDFLAAIDARLADFRAGGAQDYMSFASSSATSRLDLTRQFQAVYQSAGPGIDTKA